MARRSKVEGSGTAVVILRSMIPKDSPLWVRSLVTLSRFEANNSAGVLIASKYSFRNRDPSPKKSWSQTRVACKRLSNPVTELSGNNRISVNVAARKVVEPCVICNPESENKNAPGMSLNDPISSVCPILIVLPIIVSKALLEVAKEPSRYVANVISAAPKVSVLLLLLKFMLGLRVGLGLRLGLGLGLGLFGGVGV